METEELLLAQMRIYIILAKSLKSGYYLNRARKTMELFNAERQNRTRIISRAA